MPALGDRRYSSAAEVIERNSIPEPNTGCWIWLLFIDGEGYGQAYWNEKRWRASRLSYEAFVAPVTPDLVICHRCDTPWCVNPAHLFLDTQAVNIADRDAKGHTARGPYAPGRKRIQGTEQWCAKLTPDQVREIRRIYSARSATQRQLAAQFGVSQRTVNQIVNRTLWAHVA